MATIFDLLEVTSISPNTSFSEANGNLLGVVDDVESEDLDDGEFDEGDIVDIGGTSYVIDLIQEPETAGKFILGDGTELDFGPGDEDNLDVVFLTVSDGGDVRHFIIPNDSFGDFNVREIQTGLIEEVGGNDAAVISTVDNDINVVCFTAGTMITRPDGDVVVEDIEVGDVVLTRDNGPQKVQLTITRKLDFATAPSNLKPIAFERGSLGVNRPNRRLCVSPQHRMLVTTAEGETVLAPAKALTKRPGVRVMHGKRTVTYVHLVFSRHEIILANGALTESFFPGPMALKTVPASCAAELRAIFGPDLPNQIEPSKMAARPFMRVQQARKQALEFT